MRQEIISEAMNYIDDDLIERTQTLRIKRKTKKSVWIGVGVAAACMCLVIAGEIWKKAGNPADFNTMITGQTVDDCLFFTQVKIGDRIATYNEVTTGIDMEKYVGQLYEQDNEVTWYYPRNVDNVKYLIRQKDDEALSLWIFSDFIVSAGDTYTYGDVLRVIYGVTQAEDIASITSYPSNRNNTDFGIRIQKEIGTHTYTDRDDIATFYDIVVNVKCFGAEQESVGDQNRFTYSFSTDSSDKLTSGEDTYAARFLTITLKNGTTIDSWKYDALSGSFFEYGGIFTEPISDEAVDTLNQMFGIQ
jgi:hypothetical protein